MYTLILTIILTNGFGASESSATSVTPVHGFTSQQACLTAGNEWLRENRKTNRGKYATMTALCVRK